MREGPRAGCQDLPMETKASGQAGAERSETTRNQTTSADRPHAYPPPATPTTTTAGSTSVTVCRDADEAATLAAAWVSGFLNMTIAQRGTVSFAVSGGSTPATMFRVLSNYDIDWRNVHLLQVDERLAPISSADRNLTQLHQCLIDLIDIPPVNIHPMPVDLEMAPDARAHEYERLLTKVAPGGIDLVHLGLGMDGHTASLIPGDPGLGANDRNVTFTGLYQGFRRLTLTYSELTRAHALLWLTPGADKSRPLRQLLNRDPLIPAGRVVHHNQTLFCDLAAANESTSAGLLRS